MAILVVDDESESRALLIAMLTAEGYEVRPADSGKLALASIAVKRPELILLDIRMPGMDGFEVCRILKANAETRDIPLIFLSANRDLHARIDGLRIGAVDFVTKPFQREELLARVSTHLELGRLRAHLEQQVAERTAELRESEERFRTMANAAPVMLWVSGVDKLCTFFNFRWLEFTGRTMDQELGDGWVANVHPGDLERCLGVYSSSFDARRSFQIEYRLQRADGEYRWVLDAGIPRFTSGGVFQGYIGSASDITDLKHSHEKMLAVQKLQSLGVMAAGVAHDFSNLLSGILMESELALEQMSSDAAGREVLERISGIANGAVEFVQLLLTTAGAGIDPNSAELVDISAIAEETLALLKGSISKRALVQTKFARDLGLVQGNCAQIRQVAMNLITNASEAIGDKEGTVTISTERFVIGPESGAEASTGVPEGEYVRLTVSDTGCGMTPEIRARIFDQFFTTKTSGRGLGLAAVHGIVRSHGGAINVVSTLSAGSSFEVLLPCTTRAEKRAPAASASG